MNHCQELAPKGMLATMTALTGIFHFSLGRGLGALIGGNLIAAYGYRVAFRGFAAMSGTMGLVYFVLVLLLKRTRPSYADVPRSEPVELDDVGPCVTKADVAKA